MYLYIYIYKYIHAQGNYAIESRQRLADHPTFSSVGPWQAASAPSDLSEDGHRESLYNWLVVWNINFIFPYIRVIKW